MSPTLLRRSRRFVATPLEIPVESVMLTQSATGEVWICRLDNVVEALYLSMQLRRTFQATGGKTPPIINLHILRQHCNEQLRIRLELYRFVQKNVLTVKVRRYLFAS